MRVWTVGGGEKQIRNEIPEGGVFGVGRFDRRETGGEGSQGKLG